MVNFGSTFLDGKIDKYNDSIRNLMYEKLEKKGLDKDTPAGKRYIEKFRSEHPILYSDVDKVADHIDHIVRLCGVKCVGFGSDYDGVGDSLPTGLKDVAAYPNLIAELISRGYSDEDIRQMCGENLLRVWQNVMDFSEQN
jgi:membrane dipeptidase